MPKNLGQYFEPLSTPRKDDVDKCYSPTNTPPYPVTSVNGKTGAVSLQATDVSALPSSTTYVSSVNGHSGAVSLGASDVNALPSSTTFVSSVNGQSGAVTISVSGGPNVTLSENPPSSPNNGDLWYQIL